MRLGIIGAGWVARDYAIPAAETAGIAVAATADPSAAAQDWARAQGFAAYSDLDALIAAAACDAVYVATPNHLHREQTCRALGAGLSVLCEKPMAITEKDADAITAAAKDAPPGAVYVTAFDQRHHPAHRRMRQLIATGRVGEVVQVRIDYACWVGRDFASDNWRLDADRAGGGAVIDLAPHGLDLFEWLTGRALREVSVMRQRRVQDYAVDDGGTLSGRTEDGVLLSHTVAYNRPEWMPRRRLEVIGTKGMLVAEKTMGQRPGGRLTLLTDEGSEDIDFDRTLSPFSEQMRAFAASVAAGSADRPCRDDARLCRLLLEALEEDGSWR